MKIMKLTSLFLILALVTSIANAQDNYKKSSGKFTIEGTSSLHDWDMTTGDFTLNSRIDLSEGGINVSNLNLKVKVSSIKSTKGSTMDGKAHDALKEEKNPYIYYTLNRVRTITNKGNHYLLDTVGELTVAGVRKTIYMNVKANAMADGTVRFEGSIPLKMTNYNMDPPKALMGTIKTGDDVTVLFNVTVSKS